MASLPRILRAVVPVLGVVVVLIGTPAPGLAAPTVSSIQQQAQDAQSKLDQMSASLGQTMSTYNSASGELAKTREQIAANTKRLTELDASLKAGKARLGDQANYLYRTDGTGFLNALFSAKSFQEFANRLRVMMIISSQDAKLMVALKDQSAEVTRLTAELKERELQQAALVASVTQERDAAMAAVAEQQKFVKSLSAEVAAILEAQRAAARAGSGSGASYGTDLTQATVDGQGGYIVMAGEPTAYRTTGIAFDGITSWYGNAGSGAYTSSGRRFNENELTCAHPSLPFGTRLAVSYGSKRIIVVVTDRGPYSGSRILDITKRSAEILGIKSMGLADVHVEVISPL
ncbi:MAG: hypothetical protein HGA39_02830 [Coriobacteriia bacterium]|nr:hypothetical protein [Coriobacteriia bacterium]